MITLTITAAFLAPVVVHGQELVTDRPDQTESSVTVPDHHWQLETGWTWSRDEGDGFRLDTSEGPGTLLRWGLANDWELRFGWAGWAREELEVGGRSTVVDGATDGELGAKVRLAEERGSRPEIALLFSTSVPLGDSDLGSDAFDPSFRFCLSHTLSDRLSLGYNLGLEWQTASAGDEEHTLSSGVYTVALGIELGERKGAFVEQQVFSDAGRRHEGASQGSNFLLLSN
jgi:hypothetical protein